MKNNKSHFKVHIWKAFGDVPTRAFVEQPMQAKLGEWIRQLKAEKGKNGRQTVNNIVASFKSFLDFAVSPEGGSLLRENPLRAEWIRKLMPKRRKSDARFSMLDHAPLSPEHVQKVLDNRNVDLQWRARIALVFTSPMRDGEIAGLQIKDLCRDTLVPFLDVNKACVLNHRDGFAKLGAPKKEWSLRKLPLHPAAVAGLQEWLDNGWEEFVGRPPRPEDPVFPRDDGEFGRPDSAEAFRDALRLCELPDEIQGVPLVFHDARGCVVTWLVNAHVEGGLLRRLLGQAPVGAAEQRYFKGDLLPALAEVQKKIPLTWSSSPT